MTQTEKRLYLINHLKNESEQYKNIDIPADTYEQKRLLRGLMNIRMPSNISEDFLKVQDEYLKAEIAMKGITDVNTFAKSENGIYLWQGDITSLECDAIVNAANSGMTGCYVPNHRCIDNCIHTFAGVQLRTKCADIMRKQGREERVGGAKITPAYNLPCRYIIHTVGPYIYDKPTNNDKRLLASCYKSCLKIAEEYKLKSIAFCCISTGEFHFPPKLAAEIAVETVVEHLQNKNSIERVIFNVFKDSDKQIYSQLLKKY